MKNESKEKNPNQSACAHMKDSVGAILLGQALSDSPRAHKIDSVFMVL